MLFVTVITVKKYFDTQNHDVERVGPIKCCGDSKIQEDVANTPEPVISNVLNAENESGTVEDEVVSENELVRQSTLTSIVKSESTNF